MKPVELQTVEEDQETQKPVYRGLQAAQKSLDVAMAAQKHYSNAISQLLAAYNFRAREVTRLREQLRQKATQYALDGKLNEFEPELSEGCQLIVTTLEEIDRLNFAKNALEREQPMKDKEVTGCLGEVSKLKGYVVNYEKAKVEYAEIYRAAVAHEAARHQFSTEGPPGVGRMHTLRSQLESLAGFLGCYSDFQQYIKDLEAEG